MRWIWIDRVVELERGRRCVAIKNVTLSEDVLHDHFAADPPGGAFGRQARPVMPHSLVIEGMAQTAGILVGHANEFREKVILAKIGRAVFDCAAGPGVTLRYTAELERLDPTGASTTGTVERIDPAGGQVVPMARIDLLFSHIDRNLAGLEFPEHNFVFTGPLIDMLRQSDGLI